MAGQKFEITYQMPEGEEPHLWGMATTDKIADWAKGLMTQHKLRFEDYQLTAYSDNDKMAIRAVLEPRTTRQDAADE